MTTTATVVVALVATPLPSTNAAFASLAFTATDAAGAALPVQDIVPAAGATSAQAVFNVANSAVGTMTFGVVAMDASGKPIGSPVTGSAVIGVPPVPTYPAPQSPLTITLA